jgi:hypothetical protein
MEANGMVITERQSKALKQLADAYYELSQVWSDDWEGPEAFGGVLDQMGVLPQISLDEASGELENAYQYGMMLIHGLEIIRDTFNGTTSFDYSDDTYHYYRTNVSGGVDQLHRVNKVTGVYEYRFELSFPLDTWYEDEMITNAIQHKQAQLFPA